MQDMAMTQLPVCQVSYNVVDERGANAQVQAYLPATTTLSDATTRAAALRTAIAALTEGSITSQSITYGFVDPVAPAPGENTRVEQKGVFVFRSASTQLTRIQIPAFPLTLVTVTGSIDEDLPLVNALVVEMVNNGWTASLGSDIVALERSYQIMRTTTRNRRARDDRPD
jgi:hypothetical protein